MRIIFFDTETTGTPKDYKASMTNVENWPRVIQLGWQLVHVDAPTTIISSGNDLVKPDGWTIPTDKFWLENGFHTKTSLEKGKPIAQLLASFIEAVNTADWLVAHNIGFDYPILGAEMIRAGVRASKKLQTFCTMQSTIQYCKIPFANSRYSKSTNYKWPKLEELYRKLFKKEMKGAHDANADVTACRECFFELLRLGVIKLPAVTA